MSSASAIQQQLLEGGICTEIEAIRPDVWLTDKGKVFVKIGTGGSAAEQAILQYEAEGLARMAAAAPSLKVPRPWLVGQTASGDGFIVMDYLELASPQTQGYQEQLGAGLAEMHLAKASHSTFGFPIDGCCGALEQPNNSEGRQMSWIEFWNEFRLGSQLTHAKRNYPADTKLHELGAQLSKRLPELFSMLVVEDIRPSLLHGDLWSGNYGFDKTSGLPAIYDPACYYGHYEADHGINYMFGGGFAFRNTGYESHISPALGYAKRALLYELHHHLNHYNIFGSSYRSSCVDLMQEILK